MDRFAGILEFTTTVEAGSFTEAALRLGMSKSQVSKKVSQLEKRLGTRLFQRSTRTLTLTEAGDLYFERCSRMLFELQDTEFDLTQAVDVPKGVLKISTPVTLGEFFIASALAEFVAQYPEVVVDMDLSTRNVNIIDEGFDLAIRIGHLDDSSLVARHLADTHFYLAASPEYVHRHGEPEDLESLRSHNCLVAGTHGPLSGATWKFAGDNGNGDIRKVRVKGNWCSNNCYALISAARRGLGLIWLPDILVEADLEAGRLVSLLDTHRLPSTIWAVYPARKHVPAKVHMFIGQLKAALQARHHAREMLGAGLV